MGGCVSGDTPTMDNLDIKQGDLKRTQNVGGPPRQAPTPTRRIASL